MRLLSFLTESFKRNNQKLKLGRWGEKSNVENWMLNYHPEPGYQNNKKEQWVRNMNQRGIKTKIIHNNRK